MLRKNFNTDARMYPPSEKLFPFRGEFVLEGTGVQYVQWLPGSLFAIDAHVYRSLGGLDDRVFLFYEEQILGKKFLKAGYRMAVDTDISYFHNHSVSIRKSMKRYEAVKRLFLSKYFFYTEYGEISMAARRSSFSAQPSPMVFL